MNWVYSFIFIFSTNLWATELTVIDLRYTVEKNVVTMSTYKDDKKNIHYKMGYTKGKKSKEKENITKAEFTNFQKYFNETIKDLAKTEKCVKNVQVTKGQLRTCYKVKDMKEKKELNKFFYQVEKFVLGKHTKESILLDTLLDNPH